MASSSEKETVIGPETRVSGELRGEEDLLVRGRIDGRVQLTQTLTIAESGIVQADVDVRALVVSGTLVGNINATETVRLTSKARVVGDVSAPRFVMEAGAAYRGRVQTGEESGRAASRSAGASRPASNDRQAPPRMAAPARAATTTVRAPAPPTAPPRVVSAPPRPAAPPSMARPEAAAGGGAPSWAKKKQLRRR
jgi:cytoskeletal protein CcmA (bactofilin family)